MPSAKTCALPLALLTALAATAADAHTGPAVAGGFASGFAHPLLGWDHIAAMAAVGLWGAALGGRALWLLPAAFPLAMCLGAALGALGVGLPGVEAGVALSCLALGLCVVAAVRASAAIAMAVVGVFALFHGHAHGTEMPAAVAPLAYGAGFVAATVALHLSGATLGLYARATARPAVTRAVGALIAATGGALLFGLA